MAKAKIHSGTERRAHGRWFSAGLWALLSLYLALSIARASLIAINYGPFAGCTSCMFSASFSSDLQLVALGWLLLAIALSAGRVLQSFFVLPALGLALLMALDVALLGTLNQRVYLNDVFKFGGEWQASLDVISAILNSKMAVPSILGVCWIAGCTLALLPGHASRKLSTNLLGAALLAFTIGTLGNYWTPAYVHAVGYRNLIQNELADGSNRKYSSEFLESQARIDMPAQSCEPGHSEHRDVIMLIVESLSSYHSNLLGGARDDTPELDAIAQKNRYFTTFIANGFTTDMGMIALLTGEIPVPGRGRRSSLKAFHGFGAGEHSIPRRLQPIGYESAFFTSGDLGFLDKRPWLNGLGFSHVEGAEASFYEGMPRFAFGAAKDEALYARFRQWLAERNNSLPLFAALLTVQSHPPYVNRESGEFDEDRIIRAVDGAAAKFVSDLRSDGYFERGGLLLISGDHRAMTALNPEESSKGARAFALVPMIIVGGHDSWKESRIDGLFQQADLLPSMLEMAGDVSCGPAGHGTFLRDDPVPARWALHVRGDRRDRLDYYSSNGDAWLRLDGDDSDWSGDVPANAASIAAKIHMDRARRGELDNDMPALMRILAH